MAKIKLNLQIETDSNRPFSKTQIHLIQACLNRQFQDAKFFIESVEGGVDVKRGIVWNEDSAEALTVWERQFLQSIDRGHVPTSQIHPSDRVKITRLRRKLPKNMRVQNVRGLGYSLVKN